MVGIVCDENVRTAYRTVLEGEGYDVERVQDVNELGVGAADGTILTYCRETDAVLLTSDDDFLGSVGSHSGILYLDSQTRPPRVIGTAVRRIDEWIGLDRLDDRVEHVPDGWVE